MIYKTIGDAEKNKAITEFIKAQETDHMLFTINKQRFEEMVKTLPEGEFKEKIKAEIPVLESRIAEVENILSNTYPQISDQEIEAEISQIKTEEVA